WVAFVRGGGAMIASANCPMNQTTGNLIALRIGAAGPPTITTTWCQATGGNVSSPISTTTDGRANAIVWTLGTDNMRQLRGFDGETGAMIFAGGGPGDLFTAVRHFATLIAVHGRL